MTNNDEQARNPVLAYADSYRSMANQGAESVPVWSVITDLERNIAPLYAALVAERDADKKLIAEFQRQEHYRTRQAVIDGLAASGECWDDIKEYMEKWDAEAERIKLEVGE